MRPALRHPAFAPAPQQDGGLGNVIKNAVGNAMQEVRAELQGQLAELQGQRAELQAQLAQAGSRAEQGRIQSRIDRLDRQINELQDGIAKIGANNVSPRVNANPLPNVPVVGTPQNFPINPQPRIDVTEIVATSLGILFIAFPLTLAIVRFIWKRSTSAPSPAITAEQVKRFDRLEQSVDAIAIEVERISENQRYLTKLLGESKQTAKIGS